MSQKNAVKNVPLGFFNAASLHAVNFAILVNGLLAESCFAIRVSNDSSAIVTVSFDGITAHDIILADDTLEINLLNSAGKDVNFAKGAGIYVRGNPAAGFIYFGGYYRDPAN